MCTVLLAARGVLLQKVKQYLHAFLPYTSKLLKRLSACSKGKEISRHLRNKRGRKLNDLSNFELYGVALGWFYFLFVFLVFSQPCEKETLALTLFLPSFISLSCYSPNQVKRQWDQFYSLCIFVCLPGLRQIDHGKKHDHKHHQEKTAHHKTEWDCLFAYDWQDVGRNKSWLCVWLTELPGILTSHKTKENETTSTNHKRGKKAEHVRLL